METLYGKRGIIFGVANERSLAWGAAQQLSAAGAELAFTYLNEPIEKRVRPLAESLNSKLVLPCDVGKDEDIERVFEILREKWGEIDFIVHSVAFADKNDLNIGLSQVSRDGFMKAIDISTYSLIPITRCAVPLMKKGGSIVTMTYLGSTRVIPNYGVMGVAKAALEASVRYLAAELGKKKIRVNSLSAGPVKTLAASGIANFSEKIKLMDERSPLRRCNTIKEIGNSTLYLISDLSSGVTGETHFVDSGFNIQGG